MSRFSKTMGFAFGKSAAPGTLISKDFRSTKLTHSTSGRRRDTKR